jgi:hypothetical protein
MRRLRNDFDRGLFTANGARSDDSDDLAFKSSESSDLASVSTWNGVTGGFGKALSLKMVSSSHMR